MQGAQMYREKYFSPSEIVNVDEAAQIAEELVNNYFKMSTGQWLKNKYDIKTARDLAVHEHVEGPFAQVIKYEARKTPALLSSSSYTLYRICLQDHTILSTIKKHNLLLEPFLLYILTHELVHVIRFSKYKHRYENRNEADVSLNEERQVHMFTYEILKPCKFKGIKEVFQFYGEWIREKEENI